LSLEFFDSGLLGVYLAAIVVGAVEMWDALFTFHISLAQRLLNSASVPRAGHS
jgi:hypothetical protein